MIGKLKAQAEPMCNRCPEHLATGKLKAQTELSAYGIMNATDSNGVAARKRSLNHDLRFYIQRNRHGIMSVILST